MEIVERHTYYDDIYGLAGRFGFVVRSRWTVDQTYVRVWCPDCNRVMLWKRPQYGHPTEFPEHRQTCKGCRTLWWLRLDSDGVATMFANDSLRF